MNPSLVNWLPWSVLKTYGLCFPSAASRASMHKAGSKVLDRRQLSTYRLYQSMMATRYRNPGPWAVR